MTATLAILCIGAFAAVSFLTSALIGVLGLALGRVRLSARAEARLSFAAALTPALVGLTAVGVALIPSLGWLPDHCLEHAPHHPHLCVHHHAAGLPALPLLALAGLLLARWLAAAARVARGLHRLAHTTRALAATARVRDELHILPTAVPEAFVVGLLRTRVYVSEGLLGMSAADDLLAPVLAHERAHARRRDPLRHLIATLALACHLPGVAARLERRIRCAQEMAADAEAADTLGDAARVAGALVRLARARLAQPGLLAFAGDDVAARVHRLLRTAPGSERPGPAAIAALALALPLTMLAAAGTVHHTIETVIGILS